MKKQLERGALALSIALLATSASGDLRYVSQSLGPVELQAAPERFGESMAVFRDKNGAPLLAVAALFFDTGTPNNLGVPLNAGKVWVLAGGDLALRYSLVDSPQQEFAKFGGLAVMGDVNGDGADDLLISSHFRTLEDEDLDGVGEAFLYSGQDGVQIAALQNPDPQALAQFGWAVANVGDIDGDGIADAGVSIPFEDIGGLRDVGRVVIFSGANGSLLRIVENSEPAGRDRFGWSIAGAGDLNADGVADMVVAAPGPQRVYAISGADGAVLHTLATPAPQNNAYFGRALAAGKDLTGDGVPDIVIGAPLQTANGRFAQGAIYLFNGASGELVRTINPSQPKAFARFGAALALVEDANGDGLAEILVGAPDQDVAGVQSAGQAYLLSGRDGRLLAQFDNPVPQAYAEFGSSVAAGDLDGDGYVDLLVSTLLQDYLDVSDECAERFVDQGGVAIFTRQP